MSIAVMSHNDDLLSPRSILASPNVHRATLPRRVSFEGSPHVVFIAPRPTYDPRVGPCMPMTRAEFEASQCAMSSNKGDPSMPIVVECSQASPVNTSSSNEDAGMTPKKRTSPRLSFIKQSCQLVRAVSIPLSILGCVAQFPGGPHDTIV